MKDERASIAYAQNAIGNAKQAHRKCTEIETVRHDNKILKRKIGELEQIETQSKSMRNAIQEKIFSLQSVRPKHTVEEQHQGQQLRTRTVAQQNPPWESSWLFAQKKLWDARSSFSTSNL